MKNLSIYLFAFTLILLTCCKKANLVKDDDLSGSEHIRGRLFLTDMETRLANGEPIKNRKIQIQYANSSDNINFLFSTTTDAQGYFIFQNLKDKTQYRLFFEDTLNGIRYSTTGVFTAPQDSIQLNATIDETKQNGMILSIKDANGLGAIKDAKICVFTSEILFNGGTCEGSIFTLTSNAQGKASSFQLPPSKYWLYATATINGVLLSARQTIDTIMPKGIKRIDMQLKATAVANSIEIKTVDAFGAIVPNAQLCFFTSSVLFAKDTCSGSNFQITSNAEGKATRANNAKAYYYILAKKMIDSTRYLTGRGAIQLVDGVNQPFNIILEE